MNDPIVDEVRRHRMDHTRKFGGNLDAICADLRAIQAASGHTVVRLPPRRPSSTRTTGDEHGPRHAQDAPSRRA
jgi:hypothetical protein